MDDAISLAFMNRNEQHVQQKIKTFVQPVHDRGVNIVLNEGMGREQNVQKFISDLIEKGYSTSTLADLSEVSERTIYYWKDGDRVPSRRSLEKLAEAFGKKVDDIFYYGEDTNKEDHLATNGDFIPIPYLEQTVAGGIGGTEPTGKRIKSYLAFNSQWIYSKGNPSQMVVFRVSGNSMYPIAPEGSIVLVNEESNTISNGKIYVVAHENRFKVKRLSFDKDRQEVTMSSDDGITTDDVISTREENLDFEVIGKVIWVGYEV